LGNLEGGHLPGSLREGCDRCLSPYGPVGVPGEGGPSTGSEFGEGGLWLWNISLYGRSVRGTCSAAALLGALKIMKGRMWGRASLYAGSGGQPGEDSSTRDFERWMKGAVGMERLSLKRLISEGFEGALLYWGPWKICQ
jgi:hypothetical protein